MALAAPLAVLAPELEDLLAAEHVPAAERRALVNDVLAWVARRPDPLLEMRTVLRNCEELQSRDEHGDKENEATRRALEFFERLGDADRVRRMRVLRHMR